MKYKKLINEISVRREINSVNKIMLYQEHLSESSDFIRFDWFIVQTEALNDQPCLSSHTKAKMSNLSGPKKAAELNSKDVK